MKTTGKNMTITLAIDEELLEEILGLIVGKMLEQRHHEQGNRAGAPDVIASPSFKDEDMEAAANEYMEDFQRNIEAARHGRKKNH